MFCFLTAVGGYFISSFILCHFPLILHRKKKTYFKCVHISHRGGAGEMTENTISAFKHAVERCRTDMLELDLQLTSDGVVLVSHDPSLQRLCCDPRLINSIAYSKLPIIPAQANLKLESSAQPFAKLEEVFQLFPSVPINIDVKVNNDQLIEKAHSLIKQYNREHLVVWGSMHSEVVNKLYKLNPEIPLLFSIRRFLLCIGLFYTGLLPFLPIKETYFEIPLLDMLYRNKSSQTCTSKLLVKTYRYMMTPIISHLSRRGIVTFIWTLNNADEWDTAFKMGAEGVMTDYPSELRSYLDKKSVNSLH